jgi:non-specific serine/threonine protein kinase/serine/threonine-protein kinase
MSEDQRPSDEVNATERLPTEPVPDASESGQRIGPYHLLQKIGEGGMGEVWLAEQTEPVRRKVALKVIKQGMDTKAVVARFEAERQALALMDHPAIAKVYDAGATPQGRPYFVMEHVQGVPITEHCDRHKLTNRQRLDLFMQVCEGVQHAHHKAVIHRDLKPSNVLVSIRDDQPVAKIIDFGVAKATAQRLTEQTMQTQLGQMIGTPAYMSPEQAEMTGQDIDTRTDVYALGVMLYELLVGALPFDPKEFHQAGLEGMVRKIREDEPPKPSTRLSTLGEHSTQSAERRRTELPALRRELSGDLDWITLKALEKDRTRRYSSPQELAADIERHLTDQPVLASPPSTVYRMQKFVRRHRFGVAAATAGVLMLVAFAVTMAVQAHRIASERDRAEQAKADLESVVEFQSGMLSEVDTEGIGRRLLADLRERAAEATRKRRGTEEEIEETMAWFDALFRDVNSTGAALRVIDEEILGRAGEAIETRFGEQPLIEARLRDTIGTTYLELGLYERAAPHLELALATRERSLDRDDPDTLTSINNLGVLLFAQGRPDEAESYWREALEGRRRVLGGDHPSTLLSINNMGGLLMSQGKLDEAEPYLRQALEGTRRVLGDDDPATLKAINNMGILLLERGKLAEAEPYFREALESERRVLGDAHPLTLASINQMGGLLMSQGKLAEAEPYFREALESERRVLGDDHPLTLASINRMGGLLMSQGKLAEAEPYYLEALDGLGRVLGDDHPGTAGTMNSLALLYHNQGRLDEAEPLYLEAVATQRRVLGDDHPSTLGPMANLANLYAVQGHYDKAEPLYLETLEIHERVFGENHPDTLASMNNLAVFYTAQGRSEEAKRLLEAAVARGEKAHNTETEVYPVSVHSLGELHLATGNLDEAERYLRRALELYQLQGGHQFLGLVLNQLAGLSARQGDHAKALGFLRQSLGSDNLDRRTLESPDLASLHGDPEFEAIVAEVMKRVGEE